MEFIAITFPDCIALGAQSDPTWSTTLAEVIGGAEATNQNWSEARHRFDVSLTARPVSEYHSMRDHFHEARGRAKKWPFKDFLDFEVTQANGVLLDANLVAPAGNGTFNLHKKYGTVDPYYRQITRPDTPIIVYRNGVNIMGAGAVVTYAGGTVAITGHTGGDVYTWSGTFKVPCRYDIDRLPAAAINKSEGEIIVDCGPIPIIEVKE
jgi:uncharacterized protein (TIGR02217 family)